MNKSSGPDCFYLRGDPVLQQTDGQCRECKTRVFVFLVKRPTGRAFVAVDNGQYAYTEHQCRGSPEKQAA